MERQLVCYKDLGEMDYKTAWDYQEALLQENVNIKSAAKGFIPAIDKKYSTTNHLLFVEHPPRLYFRQEW